MICLFGADGEWYVVKDFKRVVTRADLEHLPKKERGGLYTFLDGYRVWLVRDNFIDLEQSAAVLFVRDKAIGAFDLESWPGAAFEFWKQVLDENAASIATSV